MALHILMSQAPHWPERLQAILNMDDVLLLAGDAVYLQPLFRYHTRVYVREHDVELRGISLLPPAKALSDDDWVSLTLAHQPVLSWT